MSTKNSITTKRFVMRKTLIGTDTIISFTNKKGITYKYNHDEVYSTHQERFESMPCFQQYGNYTNSNAVPAFARELSEVTK